MFEKFNLLPLEIQRMIWTFAAFCDRPRVIHFALTHPEDPASSHCHSQWKHMFPSSQFKHPPLLHACQESRLIVQTSGAYEKLLYLACDPWNNFKDSDNYANNLHILDCQHEKRLEKLSKEIYWKPNMDVIYLREEHERQRCKPNSACNYLSFMVQLELCIEIDDRVKYMAFDKSVWDGRHEFMHHDGVFATHELEVCYVVVDKVSFMQQSELTTTSDSQEVIDMMFARDSERLGRDLTTMMLEEEQHAGPISASFRGDVDERSEIEVKIVTSLEEIVKDIEDRTIYQARVEARDNAAFERAMALEVLSAEWNSDSYSAVNSELDDFFDVM